MISPFSQEITRVLGWTLIHFIWQGAAVALALAGLHALLRLRSSQARYVLNLGALLTAAACPLATANALAAQEFGAPSLSPREALAWAVGDPAQPMPSSFEPILPWVVAAWLLGAGVLSIRLLIACIGARRLAIHSTTPVPEEALRMAQRLIERMGIQTAVDFRLSESVAVPCVIGCFRAVVLLPFSAMHGLSPQYLESLLAHELAHVRRHDYLVNVIQSTLETLLFYHPCVWWISSRVRVERENCCDDVAIQLVGDRITYARALTTMEELRGPMPSLVPAANGGSLKDRVRRIIASPGGGHKSRGAALWGGVAGLAAVVSVFTILRVEAETSAPLPDKDPAPRIRIRPALKETAEAAVRQPASDRAPAQLTVPAAPAPPTDPTSVAAAAMTPVEAAEAQEKAADKKPSDKKPSDKKASDKKTPPPTPPAPPAPPVPPAPPAPPAPQDLPAPPRVNAQLHEQLRSLAAELSKQGISPSERQKLVEEITAIARRLAAQATDRAAIGEDSRRLRDGGRRFMIELEPRARELADRARRFSEEARTQAESARSRAEVDRERRRNDRPDDRPKAGSAGSDLVQKHLRDRLEALEKSGQGDSQTARELRRRIEGDAGAGKGRDREVRRFVIRGGRDGAGFDHRAFEEFGKQFERHFESFGRHFEGLGRHFEDIGHRKPGDKAASEGKLSPEAQLQLKQRMQELRERMQAMRKEFQGRAGAGGKALDGPRAEELHKFIEEAMRELGKQIPQRREEARPEFGSRERDRKSKELREREGVRMEGSGSADALKALSALDGIDLTGILKGLEGSAALEGADRKELAAVGRALERLKQAGGFTALGDLRDPSRLTDERLRGLIEVIRELPGVTEKDLNEIRAGIAEARKQKKPAPDKL